MTMKITRMTSIASISFAFAASAHAQSSVTLYGTLDDGIAYIHNSGGQSSQWKMNPGGMSGNSWGMTGREDLAGSVAAIFKLESNDNPNNGTLGNNGRMFGAKAYVGLTSPTLGAVMLGRQNDPLSMLVSNVTADSYFGTFATPGDVDNYDGSMNFDNAVEWASPNWGGVTMQLMYCLGGVAGATGSGQSYAAAARYSNEHLNLATGFMHVDNGNAVYSERGTTTADSVFNSAVNSAYESARSINIARVAGNYLFGSLTLGAAFSYSQYVPDASSTFSDTEKYANGSVFASWQVKPDFYTIVGYNYTKSSGDSSAKYSQVNVGIDYLLSKRTDVYATSGYQHASGQNGLGQAQAVVGSYAVNSGASSQIVAIVGMRHHF
ncbi:porin [Caballeronia sp. dw_276]|uniref:porin n=1 Tax=Caballeronia sp. dw_276 TaxID=2719795 RepID=UPI003211AEB9